MSAIAQPGLTDCHPIISRSAASRDTWQHTFSRAFRAWRTRQKDRRALALLTDRDFHDIGHTRWELEDELAKPFWRD